MEDLKVAESELCVDPDGLDLRWGKGVKNLGVIGLGFMGRNARGIGACGFRVWAFGVGVCGSAIAPTPKKYTRKPHTLIPCRHLLLNHNNQTSPPTSRLRRDALDA